MLRMIVSLLLVFSLLIPVPAYARDVFCPAATLGSFMNPAGTATELGEQEVLRSNAVTDIPEIIYSTEFLEIEKPNIDLVPPAILTAILLGESLGLSGKEVLGSGALEPALLGIGLGMGFRLEPRQTIQQKQELKLELKQKLKMNIRLTQKLILEEGFKAFIRLYNDAQDGGNEIQYENKKSGLSFNYVRIKRDTLADRDEHNWTLRLLDDSGGAMAMVFTHEGKRGYYIFVDADKYPEKFEAIGAARQYASVVIEAKDPHYKATCLEFAMAKQLRLIREYAEWLNKAYPSRFGEVSRHLETVFKYDSAAFYDKDDDDDKEKYEESPEYIGENVIEGKDENVERLSKYFAFPAPIARNIMRGQAGNDELSARLREIKEEAFEHLAAAKKAGLQNKPLKEIFFELEKDLHKKILKKLARLQGGMYVNYAYFNDEWELFVEELNDQFRAMVEDLANKYKGRELYKVYQADGLNTTGIPREGIFRDNIPIKEMIDNIFYMPYAFDHSQWKNTRGYDLITILNEIEEQETLEQRGGPTIAIALAAA